MNRLPSLDLLILVLPIHLLFTVGEDSVPFTLLFHSYIFPVFLYHVFKVSMNCFHYKDYVNIVHCLVK